MLIGEGGFILRIGRVLWIVWGCMGNKFDGCEVYTVFWLNGLLLCAVGCIIVGGREDGDGWRE